MCEQRRGLPAAGKRDRFAVTELGTGGEDGFVVIELVRRAPGQLGLVVPRHRPRVQARLSAQDALLARAATGTSGEDVVAATAQTNRLTKSSAFWATSCQPWSIVSAWPRFGIFTSSVTAVFRRCRL
jgi:hypothetical protein